LKFLCGVSSVAKSFLAKTIAEILRTSDIVGDCSLRYKHSATLGMLDN